MKKKNDPVNAFISKLENIAASLDLAADEQLRSKALKRLDDIIDGLNRIRQAVTDPDLAHKLATIRPAIAQVIEFIESSKQDGRLTALLATTKNSGQSKKREPVEIPADLSNKQIRELLQQDLSSKELQTIATQRAISTHKASRDEIKREILDNLNREEGYQRLATPT